MMPTVNVRVWAFRVWRLAVALLVVQDSRPWWRRAQVHIVWMS